LKGPQADIWRTFLFAPSLEGSRWQQMIVDPLRMGGLWLKGSKITPSERYFRNYMTKSVAELAGTYLASLAANQAALTAVGSDDKINFLDPTRSDWLAYKANGQTLVAPSSFLAPLRLALSVSLAHVIPAENRQPYSDKVINYALGKVTPTITDIIELARAKQQYTGRPMDFLPWAPEHKYNERNPKDPISWYEAALDHGPIPLSSTVEGFHNALVEQGVGDDLSKAIIGASLGLMTSVFAIHQHPTPPEKEIKP